MNHPRDLVPITLQPGPVFRRFLTQQTISIFRYFRKENNVVMFDRAFRKRMERVRPTLISPAWLDDCVRHYCIDYGRFRWMQSICTEGSRPQRNHHLEGLSFRHVKNKEGVSACELFSVLRCPTHDDLPMC